MDIATNLIFLIIFGLFGFVISKFWGWNPYRIFTDLVTVAILVPLVFFMLKVSLNPAKALDVIPEILTFFTNNIVGIVIGDIAGSIVGTITREQQ